MYEQSDEISPRSLHSYLRGERECHSIALMRSWLSTFREPESSVLEDLARRIAHAALSDADALKSTIRPNDDKEHTKRWFEIVFEFLYLYMHLTNRVADAELGQERRCKVQHQLYPLIVRPTMESIFGHWPQNLKDGIESDFSKYLNSSEIEYGDCKQLLDRDNPLSEDALFSKFAGIVCDLLGADKNNFTAYAGTFMRVIDLVLDSCNKLKLRETLREVGKEL